MQVTFKLFLPISTALLGRLNQIILVLSYRKKKKNNKRWPAVVQKQVTDHVPRKKAVREMCGIFGILGFKWVYATCRPSQLVLGVKNSPANAEDVRDAGLILGSGRSPGRGYGNPLQYSFLEKPMNRGAWQATVHNRVSKSQTWLKWFIMHAACIMPHLAIRTDICWVSSMF